MNPDSQKRLTEKKIADDKETYNRVMLYRRVFSTPDGQAVLADMSNAAGLTSRVFQLSDKGDHVAYDPLRAALRDGHRDAIIRINEILKTVVDADEKKTPKVRKT